MSDFNAMEISDDEDSLDAELIAEFELDRQDAALSELADLIHESNVVPGSNIGLAKKLELDPTGSFSVSDYARYSDPVWPFENANNMFPNRVKFDRTLEGSNTLKRALIFHLIPDFSPFNAIRSYSTTKSKGYAYRVLEKYVFQANKLNATPAHIQIISTPMLLAALDEAKNSQASSDYKELYFFIRFWGALSAQKLIPPELCLQADLRKVDTKERQRDIVAHFTGLMQAWVPYSESDLEKLMDYSLFWLEEAIPHVLEAKRHVEENGYQKIAGYSIGRAQELPTFEKLFNVEIKGKKVLGYGKRIATHKRNAQYNYTWIADYGITLDHIRNAIFIMLALVTGMRKSELSRVKFDHIYTDENGVFWITVTRTKTSKDPIYKGETQALPLPEFVGTKIREFEELRSIEPFMREGFLFQANQSVRPLKKATPAIINTLIIQLKSQINVDRIHCHRFRKTIAEILINRDERNIDLIRFLFGHHSYAMSMKYIARNPYLVRSVAQALEESFSHEFHEIVSAVRDGAYSGETANRLASQIAERPADFSGKQLKTSILVYVTHLITSGEPIFINRTAMGTYCVSAEHFTIDNLPPCLKGRAVLDENLMPDPSNCQIECRHAVVVEKAKQSIQDNIVFYQALLSNAAGGITKSVKTSLLKRIEAHESHLENLNTSRQSKQRLISLVEASA
ncbi:Phage integrase family protein [Pseudomonas helmanticensis]|uniref:Phage integrase family protein n=1 Tax=Pseudomonas helmanticensis TaxID=1471381 RepID=A0ACD2UCZ3_9PSED|nr:tyrosine-type recombinase/integrase [Pseudomonas helmanticensis]SMQ30276.1 Phage integrase family protein [Pseudomonas helmanticensis]